MTKVTARLAPGRSIDTDSFADIVSAGATVEWGADGLLSVTFDADLTACELAAVRCRIVSANANDEAIRREISNLLDQDRSAARDAALTEALARLALGVF